MERRKKYLKFAALVPAMVLGGGFVGCQAGAFHLFSKPEPLPGPLPLGLNEPTKPPAEPPAAPEKPPVFMPGSKSPNLTGTTIGLTPAGTNTPDLDVPLRQPTNPPAPNAPKP